MTIKVKNLLAEKELEEYKYLVKNLIDYNYNDEKRHYEEFDTEKPVDHIFLKIKKLKRLNSKL